MDMLRDSDLYRRVLESAYDGIYVTDLHRKIVYWNQGAERLSGYKAEEVVGKSCADNVLVHVDDQGNSLCLGMCPLAHTMRDGKMREADVFMHHKEGHRVPVSVRVTPVTDGEGRIVGGIEIFSDNSTKMAALELADTFQEIALTDTITGVGNRRYTEISLLARIDELQKDGVPFALLVGDKKTLEELGERLRMLVEKSFLLWDGHRIEGTMSLGGTLGRPEDRSQDVFSRADRALYESKEGGKNRVTIL